MQELLLSSETRSASARLLTLEPSGRGRVAELVVTLRRGEGQVHSPQPHARSAQLAAQVAVGLVLGGLGSQLAVDWQLRGAAVRVEGGSLAFAVAAATWAAARGRSLPDTLAFTGALDTDGAARAVEGISAKLEAAALGGAERVALPGEVGLPASSLMLHPIQRVEDLLRLLESPAPLRLLAVRGLAFSSAMGGSLAARALTAHLRARRGSPPALVLVVGDLTEDGTPAALARAERYFEQELLEAMPGAKAEQILFVPGPQDRLRQGPAPLGLEHPAALDAALGSPSSRARLLTAVQPWRGLCRRWGLADGLPGWLRRREIEGREVELLGLNSVWADPSPGEALVGVSQLRDFGAAPAALRVVLTHHPPEALRAWDGAALRSRLRAADLLLCAEAEGADHADGPTRLALPRTSMVLVDVQPEDRAVRVERWRLQADAWRLADAQGLRLRPRSAPSATEPMRGVRAAAPPPQRSPGPGALLAPISSAAHLGGRRRELATLLGLVSGPAPVVLVHAPSGAGKSSLLRAGLIPALRERGRTVVLEDRPGGSLVLGRLAAALGVADDVTRVADGLGARAQGHDGPVVILDQAEALLRAPAARRALGPVIAASVGGSVRWVIACRSEACGGLLGWLEDVSREARPSLPDALLSGLFPLNLVEASKVKVWCLQPLGALGDAQVAFREAISRSLSAHEGGRWVLRESDEQRLAEAFACARRGAPRAPLVPELQVCLMQLIERARAQRLGLLSVPADTRAFVTDALEAHVHEALLRIFPDPAERTRVTVALWRALSQGEGSARGAPTAALREELGPRALERLQSPAVRLLIQEERGGQWFVTVAHDRVAEVLERLVRSPAAGVAVDTEWLELEQLVTRRVSAWAQGDPGATSLEPRLWRRLRRRRRELPETPARAAWWREVLRSRRRRSARRLALAGLLLLAGVVGAWQGAQELAERGARAAVRGGAVRHPGPALDALVELHLRHGLRGEALLQVLQQVAPVDREQILSTGFMVPPLSERPPAERAERVLGVLGALAPHLLSVEEEPVGLVGAALSALDDLAVVAPRRASELEDALAARLRAWRPPPALRVGDPLLWTTTVAGDVRLGCWPESGHLLPCQPPSREVRLAPFRVARREVSRGELERLRGGAVLPGEEDLPAAGLRYTEARAYAAWVGARVPSVAQWEAAARAGHLTRYWTGNAVEGLNAVTWNAFTAGGRSHPVGTAPSVWGAAHPLGLFNVHGNVSEWCREWWSPELRRDPLPRVEDPFQLRRRFGGGYFDNDPHVAELSQVLHNLAWAENEGSMGLRLVVEVRE
ncbi:MAG: SUMF1/EgtB/PvdO family nonheme iron enzyme [Alphaproteobacteria bacterium]|nr:SUMF1/EgtB/PvdO family nonheme iron enzyme [Alphaproteobacteria bacterium]